MTLYEHLSEAELLDLEPSGVDPAFRAKVLPAVVLVCLVFWIVLVIIVPQFVAIVFVSLFLIGCAAAVVVGAWRR